MWLLLFQRVSDVWLSNQSLDAKCKLLPQVELLFRTSELAQRAAAVLTDSKFSKSQVSIRKMFFEDEGRRLILTFNSSGACPSDLLSFVCAVVDAASIMHPLLREITIPLVQNSVATI